MTAATAARDAYQQNDEAIPARLAAATRVLGGTLVGIEQAAGTTQGYLVPVTASRTILVLGCAQKTTPNIDQDITSLAAGTPCGVDRRPALLVSAGDISTAHVGRPCYAVDNQTVSLSSSGHTRPYVGIILGFSTDGVKVGFEGRPPIGELVARLDVVAASPTAYQSELTTAGLTQAINLLASAPPGIYSVWYEVVTPFSGGAVSAVTLDVGVTGGNTDAYVDGVDILTAALSYRPGLGDGSGIITHVSGSIAALFTSVDGNLSTLTLGQVVIELRKIG